MRQKRIEEKLKIALTPSYIEVIDQSAYHRGHRDAPEEGESHFKIKISSHAFVNKCRIQVQREIHDILEDEFNTGLHALTIHTYPPE